MISGDTPIQMARHPDGSHAGRDGPLTLDEAYLVKLSSFEHVDKEDKDAVRAAVSGDESVSPGCRVTSASTQTKVAVGAGIAGDCRTFKGGKRHIIRLFLAGDFLPENDAEQTIVALGPVETIHFSAASDAWARPSVIKAAARARAVDDAVFHQWVATLGGQPAEAKIGYLLQEVCWRLGRIEPTSTLRFRFPLTQQHLAEMTGLSLVHTNKSLRSLERAGLLKMRFGHVEICDPEALGRLTEFEPERVVRSSLPRPDAFRAAARGTSSVDAKQMRSRLG